MEGPPNVIGCNEIFSPPVANLFHPTTTAVPSSSDHFIPIRRNSSITAPSVQSSLSSDGRITPVKFDSSNSKKNGEFAWKQQLEDNERKEAAQNRKIVAEQSVRVADCTLRISDCMERLVSNNQEEMSKVVDDKPNNLKTEMLSTMNTKLDSFLNQIGQMLNRGNNNNN